MLTPRVSVIMPVYDSLQYLREAVESVLNQTYTDFEFIIIDDGSSDGSIRLLKELASQDDRIRLICSPHRGYSPCLYDGVMRAQGEFVARMDSDDVAVATRLGLQVAFLDQHPQCVAVGGQVIMIDSDGDHIAPMYKVRSHTEIDSLHLIERGGHIVHPSAMMRTSAVRHVGNYRPEMEPAEDLDLWLRLAEIGTLANLPEFLLHYRCHFQSVSHTRIGRQRDRSNEAVDQARKRRGIATPPVPTRVTEKLPTAQEIGWSYVRVAFKAGNYRTARKHARRLILRTPFNPTAWWLFIGAELGHHARRIHPLLKSSAANRI